jgi:hypothetical protein
MGEEVGTQQPLVAAEQQNGVINHECYFPRLTSEHSEPARWRTIERVLNRHSGRSALQSACARMDVVVPAVFKTAWALTLGRYAGTETAGYYAVEVSHGRNVTSLASTQWEESTSIFQILKDTSAKSDGAIVGEEYTRDGFGARPEALGRATANSCMLVRDGNEWPEMAHSILRDMPEVREN